MIKIVRSLLGYNLAFQLADWRKAWIPNKMQVSIKRNEEIERAKRTRFYSSFIKNSDLFFDVGANLGNRVAPMLDIGAKVVAVEPQEYCYKYLQYKFGKKIQIVTKGLGDCESIQDFHISKYNVYSSFSTEWINSVKEGRFKGVHWKKVIKVKMTTLDNLITEFGLPVFIKIDVEGYELNVLKGLSKSVKMISFEFTVPEQTDKAIACINQIEKIDSNIECNFSIGESMEFALEEWISPVDIRTQIASDNFAKIGFGDIYVRNRSVHSIG
ncbi:MAG: FkbM family methyltransferase [Ginsengibacter sp.]